MRTEVFLKTAGPIHLKLVHGYKKKRTNLGPGYAKLCSSRFLSLME